MYNHHGFVSNYNMILYLSHCPDFTSKIIIWKVFCSQDFQCSLSCRNRKKINKRFKQLFIWFISSNFKNIYLQWQIVVMRELFRISVTIVLSVLLRFTASDYLFGIFKLFLHCMRICSYLNIITLPAFIRFIPYTTSNLIIKGLTTGVVTGAETFFLSQFRFFRIYCFYSFWNSCYTYIAMSFVNQTIRVTQYNIMW